MIVVGPLLYFKLMQVMGPQADPDSNLQYKNDFLYKQKGGPPLGTISLSHMEFAFQVLIF